MSPSSTYTFALRDRLETAERAARQLSDACFAAWGAIDQQAPGLHRSANVIMDCSYMASATARLLSRPDEYQLQTIAMNVSVCRRVARRCLQVCEEQPALAFATCARAVRQTVDAFSALLHFLWDSSSSGIDRRSFDVEQDESVA